jgi:GNAT superfamily N-acetyltransferase
MREDEFEQWLSSMRDGYAEEMVVNGRASEDRARDKAVKDLEQPFPGGAPSADQSVFVIEADGRPVGDLWVAEREGDLQHSLWIYDVHIDEAERGRGYGKAAMVYAEEEARRRGLNRVDLMVFGGNEVARNLYRSLGYAESRCSCKPLRAAGPTRLAHQPAASIVSPQSCLYP